MQQLFSTPHQVHTFDHTGYITCHTANPHTGYNILTILATTYNIITSHRLQCGHLNINTLATTHNTHHTGCNAAISTSTH
ncbi:hypothetical protein ACLKA6_001899 [Drosophila palustris]